MSPKVFTSHDFSTFSGTEKYVLVMMQSHSLSTWFIIGGSLLWSFFNNDLFHRDLLASPRVRWRLSLGLTLVLAMNRSLSKHNWSGKRFYMSSEPWRRKIQFSDFLFGSAYPLGDWNHLPPLIHLSVWLFDGSWVALDGIPFWPYLSCTLYEDKHERRVCKIFGKLVFLLNYRYLVW